MRRSSLFPAGLKHTPARRVAGLVAALWWAAQPWLTERYYEAQLGRGAYPPEADSIGIPIGYAKAAWVVVTPVLLVVVGLLLWRAYRPGAALLAFSRAHWARAAGSTVVAVGASALLVDSALGDWQDGYPALALAQLPGLLAIAWLRAGCAAEAQRGRTNAPAI